jgi:hypothetical protein
VHGIATSNTLPATKTTGPPVEDESFAPARK